MKRLLLVVGISASLVLSACGSSPAAKKAALKSYVASLGASPTLQVSLSGSFTGAGSAHAQQIVKALTFGLNFSSTTGGAISKSAGKVNLEITANVHGSTFIDIRDVSNNLYFKLDVNKLAAVPGVHLPANEAADVQLVFGGRWFELPEAFLNSIVPKKDAAGTVAAEDKSKEAKVIDALTNIIVTTPSTSTSSGYTETGTILSFAKALVAEFPSLGKNGAPTAKNAKGTFTLAVSVAGSSATGASISVTAPTSKGKVATGSLSATFAHASTDVAAPSGATVISKSMLRQFGL